MNSKLKKTSNRSKKRFNNRLLRLFAPAPLPKKRKIILRPIGKVYNLREIYDEINGQYFNSKLNLHITWFGSGVVPKSSILFGSYTFGLELVKVNRVLDTEEVPLSFVRYIVYHEMLHHVFPPKRGRRGRRDIHHGEFKDRERQFNEFEEAKDFLKKWRAKHFPSR